MSASTIRSEVRGLDVILDESSLGIAQAGEFLAGPVTLAPDEADRLRLEMAKAQLWEWNQLEELKARAELRHRRSLAAWLVMCLAAFSVYVGYPDFYLPTFLALTSLFLWWRAGHLDQRAEQEARDERSRFQANWDYIQQRLEESDTE